MQGLQILVPCSKGNWKQWKWKTENENETVQI